MLLCELDTQDICFPTVRAVVKKKIIPNNLVESARVY